MLRNLFSKGSLSATIAMSRGNIRVIKVAFRNSIHKWGRWGSF